MAYVCDSLILENGVQTCAVWVKQTSGFNLFDISVADANLLISQVVVIFATVYVYNVISDVFKKG